MSENFGLIRESGILSVGVPGSWRSKAIPRPAVPWGRMLFEESPKMRARTLTDKQKSQWAIDGYVVLEGLLTPTEVGEITRHVDRLYKDHLARNPDADPKAGLDRRDALEVCEPLIDMIDHPRVFDIVLDLLGPYIQLSMAEVLVRPPPTPISRGSYIRTAARRCAEFGSRKRACRSS